MPVRNTSDSWGWPARLLHWAMALLIIGMLAFGFYLTNAYNPGDFAKGDLVQIHKSFGFVVFTLAVLRVAWRAFNPPPAPVPMSGLQKAAVHGTHVALYLLIFALPLTGWLMSSASPFNDPGSYPVQIKNMVFGLFEMPDPYPEGDAELSKWFGAVHYYCALAMAGILGLHVAGTLYHALIAKDGVLTRMVRGRAD